MSRETPAYRQILLLSASEMESVDVARRIDDAPLLTILDRIDVFVSPELLPQAWIDIINDDDLLLLNAETIYIPESVITQVSEKIAYLYHLVPLSEDSSVLTVAIGEPIPETAEDLMFLLQKQFTLALCTPNASRNLLARFYPAPDGKIEKIKEKLSEVETRRQQPIKEPTPAEFLDDLLIESVRQQAVKLTFLKQKVSLKILCINDDEETLVDYLPRNFGLRVLAELQDLLNIPPRGLFEKLSSHEAIIRIDDQHVRLQAEKLTGETDGVSLAIDYQPGKSN